MQVHFKLMVKKRSFPLADVNNRLGARIIKRRKSEWFQEYLDRNIAGVISFQSRQQKEVLVNLLRQTTSL